MSLRNAAAIAGFAELGPARVMENETTLSLMTKVAKAAIDDAGLPPGTVDGLLIHPIPGISLVAPTTVAEQLAMQPRYAGMVDLGGASGAGMVWRAAAAINAGMCDAVVCVTAGERRSAKGWVGAGLSLENAPWLELEVPFGAVGANFAYAQLAMRYQHEYGVTDEQRAAVAVAQRANGAANPLATFRDPITVEDVLGSELVLDPLHLLEIVMPVAGASAVVVARNDLAAAGPHRSVPLLGAGERATHTQLSWSPSLTDTGIGPAARAAFEMAGVKPADVGLASLYDCYTITVLAALEEAGFCGRGEAGGFVTERDLTWTGDFPVNTHGGQLSLGQAGIAGGMTHVTEAVRQLQGRAGGRQIPGLELAYVHGNGGILAEQVGLVLGVAA